MYPNFASKQDRESKHQALLARIARDQRLESTKREAYANAIWATDSEQNKLKDATETGDTLSRIMAAMKSNSHSATAVGDIYEKMSSSNAHLMTDADKDAPPSSVFSSVNEAYEATGDVPMLEEKPIPMEEVSTFKGEKSGPVDRSNLTRDDIISTFKRNPYLSNYTFRPVIVKDGKNQEHSYTLDQATGRILKPNGDRVNANNAIMRQVDWDLTRNAIWNKISSTKQRGLVIDEIRIKQHLKALFLR
ncbi:unnamed protein product [Phytophthora fragariaefolia]|uniref:Unnamed protein product n=1 Tax=Phytophthora fragariaefolia TaxID=1490495 RepID=A0A9W6XJW8_9STRA|nr:unnamed protein product [Phytophthora fragariaefolia]